MAAGQKDPGALLTIGELSSELGVAQHILRYCETRFPQLRPLQRAGNRRYYRPADVELVQRIHRLLNSEGYTVRGVQKVLRQGGSDSEGPPSRIADIPQPAEPVPSSAISLAPAVDLDRLRDLRNRLADALDS